MRNFAKENGGAIYISISKSKSMVNDQLLANCNFSDNHAENGGAIYNNDYYIIRESILYFINNSANKN